jgi:mannitol-specific phosphotransferase system IIBC component
MEPIPELTANPLANETVKTIDTADMDRAKVELEALKNNFSSSNISYLPGSSLDSVIDISACVNYCFERLAINVTKIIFHHFRTHI